MVAFQVNIYTLFDGFTDNTRGYFTSCVVVFRAPQGRRKMRAMSKMSASIICNTIFRINKRFIPLHYSPAILPFYSMSNFKPGCYSAIRALLSLYGKMTK